MVEVDRWGGSVSRLVARSLVTVGLWGGLGGCLGRSALETDQEHYEPVPGSNFTCLDDGTWVDGARLLRARTGGVLVGLRPVTGGQGGAIFAGGEGDDGMVDYVELYDEKYDVWRAQGTLAKPRTFFQGTLLADGRVLFTGGVTGEADGAGVTLAEIYDPVKENVALATPMPEGRYFHSAALMDDGRVLVAGGFRGDTNAQSVLLYDPIHNKWIDLDAPDSVKGGYVAIVTNSEGAWILTSDGVYTFDGYEFQALAGISAKMKLDVPLATDRHEGFVTIDNRGNAWVLSPTGLRSSKIWSSTDRAVTPSAVLSLCEDVFLFADQRYRLGMSKTGPVIEEVVPLRTEGAVGTRLASGSLLVVGGREDGAPSRVVQIFK